MCKNFQAIGFCPQFDALHPKLTARQTLQLFASLHGFVNPGKRVKAVLEAVSLTVHADSSVEFLRLKNIYVLDKDVSFGG